MTEMKQKNSWIDASNVMTIWLGQLLVFGLKADAHDLVLLRHDFDTRVRELLKTENLPAIREAVCKAGDQLCDIMGKRFSWSKDAVDLFSAKARAFFIAFAEGQDYIGALENLRIVDSWSGLSSCLRQKLPMPLSLLDYVLDIILPVLSADLIPDLCREIDLMFTGKPDEYDTNKAEQKLIAVVKRICFNSCLEPAAMNELSLAVLMHLPKNNKDFSLKTGYLYKILQAKFAHEEDK